MKHTRSPSLRTTVEQTGDPNRQTHQLSTERTYRSAYACEHGRLPFKL